VNLNYTLVGQMIFFAAFVLFCMKYVWPPIIGAMTEREKKIADGLAAADRASKDLELAQKKAGQSLTEAKAQAAELIEQANKRSSQIVDEAKQTARQEGERLITAAKAEIGQEKNRVIEELRKEVASIAIAGAEKILGSTVDASKHSEMLDKLAAEI
jgi:F-type H+-transporting ATPase subunit b|tara:strand:+ start:389 stop:859 length:471 start_codon:yes stop_codon:yes gene_type:complete